MILCETSMNLPWTNEGYVKLNLIWCQNLNETATQINVDNSITHCVFTIQLWSSYTSPWQPHHYIGILKRKKIKCNWETPVIDDRDALVSTYQSRLLPGGQYWLFKDLIFRGQICSHYGKIGNKVKVSLHLHSFQKIQSLHTAHTVPILLSKKTILYLLNHSCWQFSAFLTRCLVWWREADI